MYFEIIIKVKKKEKSYSHVHLYVPSLTHMMSRYLGFFPALQSLQNQLPSGIEMLRQSG